MQWQASVLIVAQTPSVARALSTWFMEAGYGAVVATSFAAAKVQLDSDPDLLVSELRLGDYNGLHLGMQARARGIPAVVMSDADPVLEREAEGLGVVYVPASPDRKRMLALGDRLLNAFGKRPGCAADAPSPAAWSFMPTFGQVTTVPSPSSSWYYVENHGRRLPPN